MSEFLLKPPTGVLLCSQEFSLRFIAEVAFYSFTEDSMLWLRVSLSGSEIGLFLLSSAMFILVRSGLSCVSFSCLCFGIRYLRVALVYWVIELIFASSTTERRLLSSVISGEIDRWSIMFKSLIKLIWKLWNPIFELCFGKIALTVPSLRRLSFLYILSLLTIDTRLSYDSLDSRTSAEEFLFWIFFDLLFFCFSV